MGRTAQGIRIPAALGLRPLLFALGLALPGAVAAQVPTTQNALPTREEINRVPIEPTQRPQSRVTVEGGIERAPCPLADPSFGDYKVTITEAVFDNLKVVDPAALRPAYEDFLGKEQPIAVVCEIRDAAATILRRQGYLAAVQVPAQEIQGGVVHFNVLMGKLVSIQVRGDAGKSERVIAGYLQRLTEEPVFNENQAERYLLLARDIPGYDVRLALRPAGTAPGEVIAEVTVLRTPVVVDFNLQNYGSRDVGRFGGLVRAEVYDVLGFGDRLVTGFYATPDFDEQKVVQAAYDLRLGSEGLSLGGRFTYAVTKPSLAAGIVGSIRSRTIVGGGELGFPLIRSQDQGLRAAGGFEAINQRTLFSGQPLTEDKLRIAYVRLDYDSIDPASVRGGRGFSLYEPRWRFGGSLEVRKGLDILGASDSCGPAPTFAACATLPARSRIEGSPTAGLVRIAGSVDFRPAAGIAFTLAPRAQYSRRPLLSYEEFSGGNFTVGRAYDPGTIVGDSGIGVTAEMRLGSLVPPSRSGFAFQPYGFFDKAWVWNRRQPSGAQPIKSDPQELMSTGIGTRIAWGDRARIDLLAAAPLQRIAFRDVNGRIFSRRGDARILVSLTTRLVPWR